MFSTRSTCACLLRRRPAVLQKVAAFSSRFPFKSSSDDFKSEFREDRERSRSVTSFYHQSAIDQVAAKPSVRLFPAAILYTGKSSDNSHVLRSAQYLHKELPVRLAHRIAGFRGLPFIVGCNPLILQIHEMYINSFHILSEYPSITDFRAEEGYTEVVRDLLDHHQNVISMLAEGFAECRRHISDENMIRNFLDKTLTSRLGIRLLAEHHIALHDSKPNYVGIINVAFSPRKLVEKKAEFVREVCENKYGRSPNVKLNGHLNVTFPYIVPPLDYILTEILKNAFRATVESHIDSVHSLPDIYITIANNPHGFAFRISDRGGGMPDDVLKKVFDYNFTTVGKVTDDRVDGGLFGEFMHSEHSGPTPGKMHGYGFGLPTARAYAEYLGGSLTLETMHGIGTDVYLRLAHIDGTTNSFRI